MIVRGKGNAVFSSSSFGICVFDHSSFGIQSREEEQVQSQITGPGVGEKGN